MCILADYLLYGDLLIKVLIICSPEFINENLDPEASIRLFFEGEHY